MAEEGGHERMERAAQRREWKGREEALDKIAREERGEVAEESGAEQSAAQKIVQEEGCSKKQEHNDCAWLCVLRVQLAAGWGFVPGCEAWFCLQM